MAHNFYKIALTDYHVNIALYDVLRLLAIKTIMKTHWQEGWGWQQECSPLLYQLIHHSWLSKYQVAQGDLGDGRPAIVLEYIPEPYGDAAQAMAMWPSYIQATFVL